MTGLPFVLSCHAWDIFVNRALVGAQLGSAAAVTVCSRAGLEHLRTQYAPSADKVRLLHHGVEIPEADLPAPRAACSDPFRVLGVGRFVPKKGFEHLLSAAAQRNFAVTLMGEGPLESSLRAQAAALDIESRVDFLGLRDAVGMAKVFAECDCICAPSVVAPDGDRDGVPNVLLEASLAGLPVVATDAGGIPDFLEDGRTGLSVPQADPAAIASAVGRLQVEPDLGRQLVAGARERVQSEFSIERTGPGLAEILRTASGG
jgi:glycosyltransferase involved in cell wall biosynthesis